LATKAGRVRGGERETARGVPRRVAGCDGKGGRADRNWCGRSGGGALVGGGGLVGGGVPIAPGVPGGGTLSDVGADAGTEPDPVALPEPPVALAVACEPATVAAKVAGLCSVKAAIAAPPARSIRAEPRHASSAEEPWCATPRGSGKVVVGADLWQGRSGFHVTEEAALDSNRRAPEGRPQVVLDRAPLSTTG
jgi:hypothetical protein